MWPRKNRGLVYFDFNEAPDVLDCGLCGSQCDVERGVWIKRTFYIGPNTGVKDVFTCPHRDRAWHKKVESLLREMEPLVSPRLRELIKLDIVDVLRANGIEYTPEM